MNKPALSTRQQTFVTAMLTHKTVAEAAAVAGVTERTGFKYLGEPVVKHALQEAKDRVLNEVTANAIGAMTLALQVLQDVAIDEAAPASARVSAAKAILDAGRDLHEQTSILERIAALEEATGHEER